MKKKTVHKSVVLIVNSLWNAINYRTNLVKSLSKKYKVTIIAEKDIDNFDLYLRNLNCEFINLKFNSRGINPIKELFSFIKLVISLKRTNPDAILSFTIKPNIYSSLIARLFCCPIINNISGLGLYFSHNKFLKKIINFLYYVSLKKSSMIFFQNERDQNYFIKKKIVKKQKIDILPGSGIDLKRFDSSRHNPSTNETITFLFVSRLLWSKGIKEFCNVAEKIKKKYNAKFQILGFIEPKSKFAVSKRQLDKWEKIGAINYIGYTNNVIDKMLQSDCIVLPSFYNEGVPRTLLEASALKIPIITTNIPGCANAVQDGLNGYLCNPRDEKDLYLKIEKFINLTKKEKVKMGNNGRIKVIREFDDKIVISKYIQVLDDIMLNI